MAAFYTFFGKGWDYEDEKVWKVYMKRGKNRSFAPFHRIFDLYFPTASIPSNSAACIASLIPLQGIRQHAGKGTDTEVVRSERTEHQTTAHGEAMEVTGNVHGSH